MNLFKRLKASLMLREAVKKADEAYQASGKRHYVLPAGGVKPELVVMDRANFRKLKQKKYITHKAMVFDLVRESFYFTPYANGSGLLTERDRRKKTAMYFQWYQSKTK